MACPVCGGMNREPIAPGFWRCTSTRVEIREFGGPGLADPRAGPGVLRERHETVCGAEYQEGGLGLELACACGTFAIGRCVVCARPVCGHHSRLSEGVRLCGEHLEAEQTKRRAAQLEVELRAQAGREDAWLQWGR